MAPYLSLWQSVVYGIDTQRKEVIHLISDRRRTCEVSVT